MSCIEVRVCHNVIKTEVRHERRGQGRGREGQKAKEKQEKKEKDEAIKVFVNSVSLDDVIWDDDESKSILIGKSAQGR
jgi:hypothetical protein